MQFHFIHDSNRRDTLMATRAKRRSNLTNKRDLPEVMGEKKTKRASTPTSRRSYGRGFGLTNRRW